MVTLLPKFIEADLLRPRIINSESGHYNAITPCPRNYPRNYGTIYGIFHIARTMGHKLLQDNWGHGNEGAVEKVLERFEQNDVSVSAVYDEALVLVKGLRLEDEKAHPVPAMYFKNTISQKKLNAKLYSDKPGA